MRPARKRKKYKHLSYEQAKALWMMGVDFERRWTDEAKYEWLSKVWVRRDEEDYEFYVGDGIVFRIEVE